MTMRWSSFHVALLVAASDTELRRDHELVEVAVGVVKVKEPDGAGVPTAWALHVQRHAVGEVLVDQLVARHAGAVGAFKIEDDPLGLATGSNRR